MYAKTSITTFFIAKIVAWIRIFYLLTKEPMKVIVYRILKYDLLIENPCICPYQLVSNINK